MRAQALILLAALGCKGQEEAVKAAPAAPPAAEKPAATSDAAPVAGRVSDGDRKGAEALLAAWLAAQNAGDFAGYEKRYAADFTGIRRSGVKVRRFDRAGWMEDRRRMFEKPMVVTAEGVVVTEHGGKVQLFFTQGFEQGTYKDAGRKWMALARSGGALMIAREEMLDSTLIARQSAALTADKAGPDARALGPGDVELGWSNERDRLYLAPIVEGRLILGRASGAIGTGPITDVAHTFDAAGGSLGGITARRAVDEKSLPPPLATRLGKTVQVLDGDLQPLCHARIASYRLEVMDWADDGAEDPPAAARALLDESPLVVAELDGAACPKGGAYGRDVDLPPLAAPGSPDQGGVEKALDGLREPDSLLTVAGVSGDSNRAVAAASGHTEDSCETQEEYRVELFLLTRKGTRWKASPLGKYEYEDEVALGVDADGDGQLEVYTERGVDLGGSRDFWHHDLRMFWPAGLGCDGCEGPECGG
jgi:ketosteroid isomerase-like protein